MTDTERLERAFREGYQTGYKNGEDDQARFEFGGGSRSTAGQKSDEDSAWEDFKEEYPI